jgi:hypothetical protein
MFSWNPDTQALTGSMQFYPPDASKEFDVDVKVPLPGLMQFDQVVGFLKIVVQGPPEGPFSLTTKGPWTHAVVIDLAADADGDGDVDSADLGLASAEGGDGIGDVLASWGSVESVVASGKIVSIAGSGQGNPQGKLTPPFGFDAGYDKFTGQPASYRLRFTLSPGATATASVAALFKENS